MPTAFCIDFSRNDGDSSRGVVVIVVPGVEEAVFEIGIIFLVVIEVVVFDLVSL